MTKLSRGQREQKTRGFHFNSGSTGFDLEVSLALPEYPIRFPDKMEIEVDISFIYNQLKIKGTMETTGYNEFRPSEYANGLYEDAKV